jgi:hypothetical protein
MLYPSTFQQTERPNRSVNPSENDLCYYHVAVIRLLPVLYSLLLPFLLCPCYEIVTAFEYQVPNTVPPGAVVAIKYCLLLFCVALTAIYFLGRGGGVCKSGSGLIFGMKFRTICGDLFWFYKYCVFSLKIVLGHVKEIF